MDREITRILVLTLHSGENEFEACKASVSRQSGVETEQIVFSGLGNVEAHRRLYTEIMSRADEFDLFLKLDADMVLTRPTALAEIADYFKARPGLDRLETQVHDHFTGKTIYGVHVFSPNVRWDMDTHHSSLFIDPAPQCPGTVIRDPDDLEIYVDHAPDPGPYQAFHFGFHRALKAFQFDFENRSAQRMVTHLAILQDLERHYEKTHRPALGLSVLAVDMVLTGALQGKTGDKSDASVEKAFERVADLTPAEIRHRVREGRMRRKFGIWKEKSISQLRLWKRARRL